LYDVFADQEYSALLCGEGLKDNSRYAYIGINPLYISSQNEENRGKDPFQLFQELIDFYSVKKYEYPMNLWSGIGYFSYDSKKYIEKLPFNAKDDLKMPNMEMVFYKDLIIFDLHAKKQYLIQVKTLETDYSDIDKILNFGKKKLRQIDVKNDLFCISQSNYESKVNRIIEYIKAGDVYEVNLSHRFNVSFSGDTYALFDELHKINPAPFSAYLSFGNYKIISSSPERFIFADGETLETRPIKGTIARGKTPNQDEQNKNTLLNSKKDEAELAMIVDLMRNDFGKVCESGSIKVLEHMRAEKFTNVWHLISIIQGQIRKNSNYYDLLKATFPGGSITGCPKIRSMEIIDELEDVARNIYTGSIFVANDMRFDSNIVIRTIIAYKNKLYFNVGGAVTYDSIPAKEYKETLDKAGSILKALQIKN
jgi:para-aminobenzoate synthetase component I